MQSSYRLVNFDPVAISLGPLDVHWYGVMYLLAFLAFWILGSWIARNRSWWQWSAEEVGDFLFYGMLGVILGGRFGYVIFYGFESLMDNPLFLFRIWEGGMSFHGGLIGGILAVAWYARKTKRNFWQVADFASALVPIGLAFGRIGNFIGGELWGRLSDVSWAMIFPGAVPASALYSTSLEEAWKSGALDNFARHPSQLYQAGLEGLALFLILMWYSASPRPRAAISGLFLTGYGVFRIMVEFFREPDQHLGFLAMDWMTMGMLLSVPMIIAGLMIFYLAYNRHIPSSGNQD
jgi:phosphatidylglycerol:prolipoprotein diacylglycerol transferase